MIWAARVGDIECLRLLIDAGCDIDRVGAGGRTAVHEACENGQGMSLAVLMAVGAELSRGDEAGFTPMSLARGAGASECVALRARAELSSMRNSGPRRAPRRRSL